MELSEIIKKMKNGESLYGLIANDYYKMSKETIKDILLDAIYLLDNDKKILAEMEAREYNLLDEISEMITYFVTIPVIVKVILAVITIIVSCK